MLRDGLFYELGVRIPPIRFVPDDTLPAGSFRVHSGAVGWVPWPGLEPGRALVNVDPDTLELHGIGAEGASFPAGGSLAAVVLAADEARVAALGLTTWDPVGHMVLAAARDLRGAAGVLLDIDAVESSLAQLEDAFPELVYAALEKISATDLTRVLRRLLASDVSIRNLRSILERLLAYACVPVDQRREIAFDPRLPIDCRLDTRHEADQVDRYTEWVRSGLQLWLSHRSPGPAGTVVVHLLDPESVERPILDELAYRQAYGLGRPLGSARLQEIRDAVRPVAERGDAAILTVPQVASFLRGELRTEFPQLPVLSYQELAWDVNVQPVGRISI
jgi:type III secretion protein V